MSDQPPGSKVLDLAVAGGYLYALTSGSSGLDSAKVYQYITSWSEVSNGTGYTLQSLHGANDRLFVGAYTTPEDKSVNRYAVLVVTGTALDLVRGPAADNQGELQAAAFFDSKYYISLAGQGIFHGTTAAALGTATALTDSAGNNFTALLPVGTTELIAVTSKCRIWKIPPGTTAVAERDYNVDFSGALALWDDGTNQLLLLGRTSSSGITTTSYTYGYWELPITGGALDVAAGLADPGNSTNTVTTVASNAKYNSSLGTHVITSLYQAPGTIDTARPLFASTQQDGLWSSRLTGNPPKEWNIE
ncbi:hypothetical protein FACS189483_11160 [Spirochaetia bacterium]|nr:hypothetical protein FACS189483_11160 [Spirochaetia bacterium]